MALTGGRTMAFKASEELTKKVADAGIVDVSKWLRGLVVADLENRPAGGVSELSERLANQSTEIDSIKARLDEIEARLAAPVTDSHDDNEKAPEDAPQVPQVRYCFDHLEEAAQVVADNVDSSNAELSDLLFDSGLVAKNGGKLTAQSITYLKSSLRSKGLWIGLEQSEDPQGDVC